MLLSKILMKLKDEQTLFVNLEEDGQRAIQIRRLLFTKALRLIN